MAQKFNVGDKVRHGWDGHYRHGHTGHGGRDMTVKRVFESDRDPGHFFCDCEWQEMGAEGAPRTLGQTFHEGTLNLAK